jgi:hypothetical protein
MSKRNDFSAGPEVVVEAATDLARELGDAGKPFLAELERICELRWERRQPNLEALSDALLSGEKYPELTPWQLRVAVMMIQAALAVPHDPSPGRPLGPSTAGQRVYEAAVELAPQYVRAAISGDLRKSAAMLAGPLADDPARCGEWKLAHLDRETRVAVIAHKIEADADRLAAECCSGRRALSQRRSLYHGYGYGLYRGSQPEIPSSRSLR